MAKLLGSIKVPQGLNPEIDRVAVFDGTAFGVTINNFCGVETGRKLVTSNGQLFIALRMDEDCPEEIVFEQVSNAAAYNVTAKPYVVEWPEQTDVDFFIGPNPKHRPPHGVA